MIRPSEENPRRIADPATRERQSNRWITYGGACVAAGVIGALVVAGARNDANQKKDRYVIVAERAPEPAPNVQPDVPSPAPIAKPAEPVEVPTIEPPRDRSDTSRSERPAQREESEQDPEGSSTDGDDEEDDEPLRGKSVWLSPAQRSDTQPFLPPIARAPKAEPVPAPEQPQKRELASVLSTRPAQSAAVPSTVINAPVNILSRPGPPSRRVPTMNVTPPVLARQPRPVVIPPDIRRLIQSERTLQIRVSVDAGGNVTGVYSVGASDRLDHSLFSVYRSAIAAWQFEPGTVNGAPTPSETVMRFRVSPLTATTQN